MLRAYFGRKTGEFQYEKSFATLLSLSEESKGNIDIITLILRRSRTENGMVLHFYQQQESSTTKTVHKVINKGLKAYV